MNATDFANSVDGLTDDFVNGKTDVGRFKLGILDLLLTIAAPHLKSSHETDIEKTPEYEFIKSVYQPSKKGEGDFFTLSDIETGFLDFFKQSRYSSPTMLRNALKRLEYERVSFRKAQYPVYGYWMKKIA